ncbi:DUF4037 domain-containing protein [Microbacterium sp. NEAU-LLB]|uniref:DUF4037 domain-containing protein n=2 Tax=Microbacterium stercoris TaxID=2820289 RepID=A0A939QMN4_9MICO|nr:DUF4037 domain-containing protein [Microbacterium stercoris]
MAEDLLGVPGIVGVTLGGSRARGTHRLDSDWDLGLYYRGELDVAALQALAGPGVEVAAPGDWGPWVDGGAWLRVDGVAVDWILRDLDRVERIWAGCRVGRYEVAVQAGHPLGFWSPCYAGELALAKVIADPSGALATLREQMTEYPEALRRALISAAWEAEFLAHNATKGASRADSLYVSLCTSRAIGILTQALHAHARRWLLNEKGALEASEALPAAPADFGARARRFTGATGRTPDELRATVSALLALVEETRAALAD